MKKKEYFSLPDNQLNENLILVFRFYERAKKDKGKVVTKFV